MVISLYVYYMIIFVTDLYCVENMKFLSSVFDMNDLGVTEIILGIKIIQDHDGIVISQSNNIENIFKRFDMFECDPAPTLVNSYLRLMKNK